MTQASNCFCSSSSLTDQHMANLAALIKDLDKELPTLQSGKFLLLFVLTSKVFFVLLHQIV